MNIKTDIGDNTLDIALEGELTIYHANDMRNSCMGVIARASMGMDMRLNMENVTEIDAAGVQLLVLLKRELQGLGVFIKVTKWSQPVEEIFDFVGLPEFLTQAPAWME
jgi:anti-sigma B factor antagonist